MAKGINIGIASDTRDFTQGIKNGVIQPLDGVSDVLNDLVRAGDKAGDSLTDSFRGQQRATEDLRRDYQRLNREIDQSGSQAASSSRDHLQRTVRDNSEAQETIRRETLANASETFSSFDGSAQSFADGLQGTFGGVIADLGPLGAAAGAAGAIGIGLISTAMQAAQERAQAFREKVGDLATEMISTGKAGRLSFGYISDALKTLATETDENADSLIKYDKQAREARVSFKDFADGSAGSSKALKRALEQVHDEQDKLFKNMQEGTGYSAGLSKADAKRLATLGRINETLLDAKKANDQAAKSAKLYAEAGGPDLEAQSEAVESYASAVQSAYQEAGASVSDFVKNGKFDLDGYAKAMEKNAADIVAYQGNMADAVALLAKGGHDKAISYLEQLGPDAAPLIAAFIKAPAAQQKSLEATWDTLGGAASTSFGSSLQSHLDATPASKTVKIGVDSSEYDNYVNSGAFKRNLRVPVSLVPTSVGSGVRVP
jgi:hypothetical protein